MLTVRIRTRDGLERLQISAECTLGQFKQALAEKLQRPENQIRISCDHTLLSSKSPETYLDLSEDESTLSSLGFINGQMIFGVYEGSRDVDPGYRKSIFSARPFGAHMDVARLMAKQAYVQSALAFSIKHCGIMYGRLEEGIVYVDAIYEPEQQGSAERLSWSNDNAEAKAAEKVASMLGLQKVGLLFNQSAGEREYIMSDEEIWQSCEISAEIGEHCIIAVFSQLDQDGQRCGLLSARKSLQREIHLEAFQCSNQAVELWKDGWFCEPSQTGDPSAESKLRNPHDASVTLPVMISGKDVDSVDNDFFLVPLAVKDHAGPLLTSFPVENRLTGQANNDLRQHLAVHANKPWHEKLADFHLMLWLAGYSGLSIDTDIAMIAESVRTRLPVMEGYAMMIESLAG